MTLGGQLARWQKDTPHQLAVATGSTRLDFGALAELSGRWASVLTDRGARDGGAVVVWCEDGAIALAAMLGAWQIGAVPVPLDPSRPAAEVITATAASGAVVVATDRASPTGGAIDDTLSVADFPEGSLPSSGSGGPSTIYFYTSGTTGLPKCVAWPDDVLVSAARALMDAADTGADDIFASTLRVELIPALVAAVVPALLTGSPVVLPALATPRGLLSILAADDVTALVTVPALLRVLLDQAANSGKRALPRLTRLFTTSAAVSTDLVQGCSQLLGAPPRSLYGTSEAGLITYNDSSDLDVLGRSVGRPVPGVLVRIVDNDNPDRTLSSGEPGEVVVSGVNAPAGYVNRPELQAAVFRSDGVHTGDLGTIDGSGYVYLSGRLSSTINRAGHLVSPEEVEQMLERHPAVEQALVYGQDTDDGSGQRVAAKVVLSSTTDSAELRKHCALLLAAYKVPATITVVEDLPRNAMGKLVRPSSNAPLTSKSPEAPQTE